jgi:hypothetical protein
LDSLGWVSMTSLISIPVENVTSGCRLSSLFLGVP